MANPNPPDGINVRIEHGNASTEGKLNIFPGARGVIALIPDGPAARQSPDAVFVESALNRAWFATLEFEVLTPQEMAQDAQDFRFRFDVDLLAARTSAAIDFISGFRQTAGLPIGLLGIGVGASAALAAAAQRPEVTAVVSIRGRTDMAWSSLAAVRAPTLLVTGQGDTRTAVLNEMAARALPGESRLELIPGASRYFDEMGALQEVADLGCRWFERHLLSVPVA